MVLNLTTLGDEPGMSALDRISFLPLRAIHRTFGTVPAISWLLLCVPGLLIFGGTNTLGFDSIKDKK